MKTHLKQLTQGSLLASLLLLASAGASWAQSSAYFDAVTSLNPAGYWPMHEVAAPAAGDIETNYGTLGLLGTGYYPDWASANGNIIQRQSSPGALAGDSDTAVHFTKNISSGSGVSFTNALVVPHTSPLSTLNPPFSVECWYMPTATAAQDILGQNGFEGLNAGNAGGGAGAICGLRFTWGGGGGNFNAYGFNNGTALYTLVSSPMEAINQWYHLVLTCDADTNFTLYVNGSLVDSRAGVGRYAPDYWTPLSFGSSRGGTRAIAGYLDEVAVYTNDLSADRIYTHYNDGLYGGAGVYFNDVTNDDPVIYFRMDAPAYSKPDVSTWPALANYGTIDGVAAGNGVYSPGTMPGLVTEPIVNPKGVPFGGVPGNLAALSGVSSFADAGYASAYDPVGAVPFTVSALFRGNPCDNRYQTIVGHSDNSWRIAMNNNGKLFCGLGTNSAGAVNSTGVYNDGNWHHVVMVYTPASDPALTGTNALYVDGVLESVNDGVSAGGIGPGSAMDVLIGGDPQYTNSPAGVGRQFAGRVCEVAFFTNSLSAAQVQALYSGLGVAPLLTAQPATDRAVNAGAGTAIDFDVAASGSEPLVYQWYFNTSPSYSGATKLVDNAVHYVNSTTSQMTLTNLAAADSGYYYAIVTNNYGAVTSALASLTVYALPTIVSESPVTYTNLFTLYAGANPSFSVSAGGAEPLYYRWYTNGVLCAGETNAAFTWANVQAGTITAYCVVSNIAASATSSVWTASVVAAPTAPYPATVLADSPIGYWRLDEPDDGNGYYDGNNGAVCHDYMGGNNGIYTNTVLGQAGYNQSTDLTDTSALFGMGYVTAYDSYAGQIQGVDFAAPDGATANFTVEAWVQGMQYQNAAGTILSKGIYGFNDAWAFDFDTTASRYYRFHVRTADGSLVTCTSSLASDNYLWHHLVGVCDQSDGVVNFYIDGKLAASRPVGTTAGAYDAAGYPMQIGSAISNAPPGSSSTLQYYGYIDDVAAYNYALSADQVAAQYASAGGVAPFFTQAPPTDVIVNGGETLTIPVTAFGTGPLSYQWYDINGGTNVATGSTDGVALDATLTVSNVPAGWDGDQLQLIVNNNYNSLYALVTLTVVTNVVITRDLPSQVTLTAGNSYTYWVGVGGPAPWSYQWYGAGVPIAGETNSTLTVTAGTPSSTTYYVVINNSFGVAVTSSVSTFTSINVSQPTNSYAMNIFQLNPAGYWPMHEVAAPAPGDIETNYGTLGLLGAAYYPDWVEDSGAFIRGWPGALANDSDTGLHFNKLISSSPGNGTWTNELYVPHTSPWSTLNPPFSVECWFYPTNAGGGSQAQSLWGQHGFEDLNAGYAGSGNGPYQGIQLGYNGKFTVYLYSNGTQYGTPSTAAEPIDQWYHLMVTCDANTNVVLYVNGVVATATNGVELYTPDYWTPLTIGGTRGGTRSTAGALDEFAVYTNVLSDTRISAHYNDGISGVAGAYFQDVTNDNPVIYLRLDAGAYTPPPLNTWPMLFNYGSAALHGVYTPGTVPGVVNGPANLQGVPLNGLGTDAKVAQLSGVSSFADAGYTSAFNPVGATPFSVSAMFRGNPCDNRIQTIVGHSDNSWRITMNTNGTLQCQLGTNTSSLVNSTGVYNDGNWHQVVEVYAPDSDPSQPGTHALYVDGALDSGVTTVSTNGLVPGSTLDVMIGSDPQYTNNPAGVGRQFAGQICEVAFFSDALTATEVQQLYEATVSPAVNTEPTDILFSIAGNELTLWWPTDHIGWRLQAQTNSLGSGLGTNWADVSGSDSTNQVVMPIDPNSGSVFYRLVYP